MERRFWEGEIEVIEILDENGNIVECYQYDWSRCN